MELTFPVADAKELAAYFAKAISEIKAEQLADNTFTTYLEAFHRVILVYPPKCMLYECAYCYLR